MRSHDRAGTASFEAVGAGNTETLTPADVEKLAALPEVAQADGSVDGLGLYVLDTDDKLIGTGGAPDPVLQLHRRPQPQRRADADP